MPGYLYILKREKKKKKILSTPYNQNLFHLNSSCFCHFVPTTFNLLHHFRRVIYLADVNPQLI